MIRRIEGYSPFVQLGYFCHPLLIDIILTNFPECWLFLDVFKTLKKEICFTGNNTIFFLQIDMPSIRKVYKKTYGIDITEEIRSKPHPTQKCLVELAMKGPQGKEKVRMCSFCTNLIFV